MGAEACVGGAANRLENYMAAIMKTTGLLITLTVMASIADADHPKNDVLASKPTKVTGKATVDSLVEELDSSEEGVHMKKEQPLSSTGASAEIKKFLNTWKKTKFDPVAAEAAAKAAATPKKAPKMLQTDSKRRPSTLNSAGHHRRSASSTVCAISSVVVVAPAVLCA